MERREKASRAIFIIFLLSFLWSIIIIFSPVFLPENSVEDLSGQTAVVDNNFLTKNLPFPMNGVYAIGDRLCHQLDERSFFANGNQMPFCSRCTAIFVGLTMGLLFISFFKVPLDERFIFVIILSLVPIGIDGVGQSLAIIGQVLDELGGQGAEDPVGHNRGAVAGRAEVVGQDVVTDLGQPGGDGAFAHAGVGHQDHKARRFGGQPAVDFLEEPLAASEVSRQALDVAAEVKGSNPGCPVDG